MQLVPLLFNIMWILIGVLLFAVVITYFTNKPYMQNTKSENLINNKEIKDLEEIKRRFIEENNLEIKLQNKKNISPKPLISKQKERLTIINSVGSYAAYQKNFAN